jgi:SWI/SNF-related matrix-associated actin-dependent regulator 1 of chromatin subfamily A
MLRYNDSTGAFLLYTNDTKAAVAAGLTLSNNIRGPKGEKVYFTANQQHQPEFNPYAALEFFDQADDVARAKLMPLMKDYQSSWADNSSLDIPVPDGTNPRTGEPFAYMDYQRAGIEYCLGRDHSIIGDEPGLGKTIQAIGIANATDARKVLFVCPASIRLNIRREIHSWSTLRRVSSYPIMKGSDGVSPHANYTIVSYDLLRNKGIHAALRSQEWDLGIFDEGHYLKTPEAQRTRAIFGGGLPAKAPGEYSFFENGLDRNIKRMVAMTGTPLPNRPREAYTLARGLNWESIDYSSQDAFASRFNPPKEIGQKEIKGRLPELNARLRTNLLVRRHKADVLPQLPDKRYEMTYIEPNGAIRDVLAREALIDFDPMDLYNDDFTIEGTPISTLRREMGEAMVPRVVEYINYMLDVVEHPKLIVYTHHRTVAAELMDMLSKYQPVIHQGGISTKAKETAKFDFINNPGVRLFIGQLDTMEGVDGLQHVCGDVVFAEPAWTPGRNEQCVDRAHRIGQHDNVVAHFLLVEGSFNEKVLNVVLDKAGDIHESLDRRIV